MSSAPRCIAIASRSRDEVQGPAAATQEASGAGEPPPRPESSARWQMTSG